MHFHDFHLEGYTVAERGSKITLRLSHCQAQQSPELSFISFSEVQAYHFVHTGGSIITNITPVPVDNLLQRIGDQLAEWRRLHGGYYNFSGDKIEYAESFQQHGFQAWEIESAIGFAGFVIGRAVEQIETGPDAPA